MNNYTKKSFDGFTNIIEYGMSSSKKVFSEYDAVYPFTNEYISSYINLVDFSKAKTALSVLGSGDHIFNLISRGIVNIDTFDINKMTEYYVLGLKRSMIIKYSYEEFLEIAKIFNYQVGYEIDLGATSIFDKNVDIIKQLVLDLYTSMDSEYREFWLRVIDFFNKECRNGYLVNYLFRAQCGRLTYNNSYLKSKYEYNSLKNKLGIANINFKASEISDISSFFGEQIYDVLFFSNVLDYVSNSFGKQWDYEKFLDFSNSVENICSDNATVFYHYLFSWRYGRVVDDQLPAFFGSNIYLDDLKDMEIATITHYNSVREGVILKKVKSLI